MDAATPKVLIAEGKTKKIFDIGIGDGTVLVVSKDDITAGDGKKHDVIPEKAKLATQTTCNVFRLLQACGVPTAFLEQKDDTSFVAHGCTMLPYEVVVRREAHGSALKRNPSLTKGHVFPKLVVEFFLKTSGKSWKGAPLVADDPYMQYKEGDSEILLYDPAKPIVGSEPFLKLRTDEVFSHPEEFEHFEEMRKIARRTFLILEKAWAILGRTLVDFKVEFGTDKYGFLLLADVIDNDSWRIVENGGYIDKQVYRDGGGLDEVAKKYKHVAELTGTFNLPNQRVILWCGSKSDNLEPFLKELNEYDIAALPVVCSIHKEPEKGAQILQHLVQKVPDSVVIAYIGRSNGAGPTLSAMSTVPVITVPASIKDFPEDVWSCLRAPSKVPVMTVLEPSNAVLAALQILSARNPKIYAALRGEIEDRLQNSMVLC